MAASQGKQQNFLSRHSKKRIVYVFLTMEHTTVQKYHDRNPTCFFK